MQMYTAVWIVHLMDNHKISKLDHIHYTNFEIFSLQISLLYVLVSSFFM